MRGHELRHALDVYIGASATCAVGHWKKGTVELIWLIPLLPAIGAAINGLVGIRSFSKRTAGMVACAMMIGALGLSLYAFWQLLDLPGDARAHDVILGD